MTDARTAFWTFAIINMAAAFGTAAIGVACIRKNEIEKHRLMMRLSAVLVGVFVAAYGIKIFALGRENLSAWSFAEVAILRIHEAFIFTFLVAGGRALFLSGNAAGSELDSAVRTSHRRAGRIAMIAFFMALFTAGMVYRTILSRPGAVTENDQPPQGSSSTLH